MHEEQSGQAVTDKAFRDPVHNYVVFDRERDAVLLRLIDTPEFQRLRRIRQLGVSELAYPGATHTRFSHGLGAAFLMSRTLEYRQRQQGREMPEHLRTAAMCAALLHDVGHAPFSHLLEELFAGDHEDLTRRLIKEGPWLPSILRDHDNGLPDLVISLLEQTDPDNWWISSMLSSQLDVDRIDYLLRDAHFTGVQCGGFDAHRLLNGYDVERDHNFSLPVWRANTRRAIEEYLFARYWMYRAVYFHHTTRGFEKLLLACLGRASDLLQEQAPLEITPRLKNVLLGKPVALDEFLRITDGEVMLNVSEWMSAGDSILATLATWFVHRKPLAHIDVSDRSMNELLEPIDAVRCLLGDRGLPSRYFLLGDDTKASVYDYYHPEEEPQEQSPNTSILVRDHQGAATEISRLVPSVRSVTGQKDIVQRFYFPREVAGEVRQILTS